jgi:hypothetical protein
MGDSSTGKTKASASCGDWRWVQMRGPTESTESVLAALQCPFRLSPETENYIPSEYTGQLVFLRTGEHNAPWTGFYGNHNGHKLAVANYAGMWFEIRQREDYWEAYCLARTSLGIKDWPLSGIQMRELVYSGNLGVKTPVVSQAPTPLSVHDADDDDDPMPPAPAQRSEPSTACAACPPQSGGGGDGDGDDFGALVANAACGLVPQYRRMVGVPPPAFTGDRSKTLLFLTKFKRFMIMNRDTKIAHDPWMKCMYFLSLVEGAQVEGWTMRMHTWLEEVEADPSVLPYRMNVWQALEQEFLKAFVDYAESEHAQKKLSELQMKDSDVDQYIADFEYNAFRAGTHPNDPYNLRQFALGLPCALTEAVIDINTPNTFEEWKIAAQKQHRSWMRKQALRNIFAPSQPRNNPGTGSSSSNSNSGNRRGWCWPRADTGTGTRPQLLPRDPNAMDTSAVARKAITEAEKQKCRQEGRCFECGKQGHLVRACPSKTRAPWPPSTSSRSNMSDTASMSAITSSDNRPTMPSGRLSAQQLAAYALQFSEEEQDAFVKAMNLREEGLDFQNA